MLRSSWVHVLAACASSVAAPSPAVAIHVAHSHNDYRQPRPLEDALELGFQSIEADVFLVAGEVLVGHERSECVPGRTLDALYLDPLARRARAGTRHAGQGRPFQLLVDIKADGEAVYRALAVRFARLGDVLTSFDHGVVTERAITVVLSGSVPRQTLATESRRYAFMDGRVRDLRAEPASAPAPSLVPLVSLPWLEEIGWLGHGEFPESARAKLGDLVARARERGYRIRFWGTPNLPSVWRVLRAAGVDLIGFDHLRAGATFLRG